MEGQVEGFEDYNKSLSSRRWNVKRRRKKEKSLSEKICDWFRSFIAFLFSNVGIVCLVIGYTVAGAFIFENIEGTYHRKIIDQYNPELSRNNTAIQLWKLTTKENVFSKKRWKFKVDLILQKYQKGIINAINNGWEDLNLNENHQWSFARSFLYSLTVITTIGYGNTCPRTMWGKVITIIYAIIGMPLFLLYLSNIGDILAKSFKWTYARFCLCRCRKRPRESRNQPNNSTSQLPARQKNINCQIVRTETGRADNSTLDNEIECISKNTSANDQDDEDDEEDDDDDDDDDKHITVPITICLSIIVGYICGGAILFSEWEEWDFLDGSYFCFVSLSTIGFGDIVPGNKMFTGEGLELSFILCSMYLMLGMALIAMCFNLMQEEVIAKINSITRTFKHIFRCDK